MTLFRVFQTLVERLQRNNGLDSIVQPQRFTQKLGGLLVA
jgi:hypothetical protein